MISATIPLKTVSEANRHEHWRARQKRAKGQREAAGLVVLAEIAMIRKTKSLELSSPIGAKALVTLTRLTPRALDDDNLRGALKAVRDGVADALGIDDRDPRVRWEYAQERAKGYAVRIEIRRAE